MVANAARRVGQAQDGGIIFYVDGTGQHGLVAALQDEPLPNDPTPPTPLPGGWWEYALMRCQDKGPGWNLPSRTQITLLWNNRYAIDPTADNGGFSSSSSIPAYWSSTQNSSSEAYNQSFLTGAQSLTMKTTKCNIRCIRTF